MTEIDRKLLFLFSRLTWPSGMVRERACSVIADLLVDSRWTKTVQRFLIHWMKAQSLESVASIGLFALLRAKINDSNFQPPRTEELLSALQSPSVLSWVLLDQLLPNNIPSPNWVTLNSGSASQDFQPDPFFSKYLSTFLTQSYNFLAEKIEANKRISFIRQWSYEWQKILDNIGMKPSRNCLHFSGWEYSDHYAAIYFQLSEIYHSSFLRAIAWAVMIQALSEEEARVLAIKTSPIDQGLWRLKHTPKPIWWPKIEKYEDKSDNILNQIWQQVEAEWERQRNHRNDWIIAEASGRVYEGIDIYDLELFGLFQISQDSSADILEELINWYRFRNFIQYVPCSLSFEGRVKLNSSVILVQRFGDWIVLPVACQASPYTTPRWQFWRMYRGIWIPSPLLSDSQPIFHCEDEALIVRDSEGIVGKWNDWTYNLKEKMTANLPPSTGQSLLVNRKRIDEFATENDSLFCWVCRLTSYHRENDFELYKPHTDQRLFL